MKKSILILFVLLSQVCLGQIFISKPTEEEKKDYSYIVIYRTYGEQWHNYSGTISPSKAWTTSIAGFVSLKKVLEFLNTKDWKGNPNVTLGENNLIAIYDLMTAKK